MADAVYTFGADVSAITKSLQQVAQNTSTMANSWTAVLARWGQAFQAVQQVATTVCSAISSAMDSCLEPARKLEDAATRLGVQLGSMQLGQDVARQLELMSANGTKSLDELARAAGALSGISGGDMGELVSLVAMVQDIAEGSGVSMATLAGTINKVGLAGKVTTRDLRPLVAAGGPIADALANEIGVAAADLQDELKEGTVSAEQLIRAMRSLTEEGGKYHRMAATMSNTGSGSLATMWASLDIVLGKIGQKVNTAITPVVQAVSAFLQRLAPQVEQWLDAWLAQVEPLSGSIMEMGHALWQVISAVGELLASVVKSPVVLGLMVQQLQNAATVCKVLATSMEILAGMIKGLAYVVNMVGGGFLADNAIAGAERAAEAAKRLREMQAKGAAPAQADGGEDAERRAAQDKARAESMLREAEEAAKRSQQIVESTIKLRRKLQESAWEAMAPADAIASVLSTVAKKSKQELLDAMASIQDAAWNGTASAEQLGEYEQLERALESIGRHEERQKKLVEERKKALQDLAKEEARYESRKLWETAQKNGLLAQEKTLRDELARVGQVGGEDVGKAASQRMEQLAKEDAKKNAAAIAQLREIRDMWDDLVQRKQEYARTQTAALTGLRADVLEYQGKDDAAAKLRAEQEVAERIEELRNEGASKRIAMEQALLEQEVKKLREIDGIARQIGSVGTRGAGYGNGYYSRVFGGDQLSETRKSNQLLTRIEQLVTKISNKKTSNVAILK